MLTRTNLRIATFMLVLFCMPSVLAAEAESVTGVVSAIDKDNKTITVRIHDDEKGRIYFIADDTRLTSKGKEISLSDIRRGNEVTLRFRATDSGREIVSLKLPNPDVMIQFIPFSVEEEWSISGMVTGKRVAKQTLTVRIDADHKRLTLKVNDDTRILRDGRSLEFANLRRGDFVDLRYRATEYGMIVITGIKRRIETPEETVVDNRPAATDDKMHPTNGLDETGTPVMAMLPKTGSNIYTSLWFAFGALGVFAAMRAWRAIRA